MKFREFFKDSTFTLLREGSANWDYYLKEHGNEKIVVCLAKPGSGAEDCFFGSVEFYSRFYPTKKSSAEVVNNVL